MKKGQKVAWTSQGKGSYTKKTGRIVRVVTKGENPYKIGQQEFPNHQKMFDGFDLPGGKKKVTEAYLIEVIVSPDSKARLYMPVPNKLRVVRSDAGTKVGLSEKDVR